MFRGTILSKCKKDGFTVFKNDNINSYIVQKENNNGFKVKINNQVKTVTFLEFPIVLNKVIGYNFEKDNFNIFGAWCDEIKDFGIE